ncbi:MAG: hypothetical protein FWC32_02565 [Firmicutes bacterium]|nr:hypothetical protein [Bacillota bacterium]
MGSVLTAIVVFVTFIVIFAPVANLFAVHPRIAILVHAAIAIWCLISWGSTLEVIVLFLVLADCLNDIRVIAKYKLSANQEYVGAKDNVLVGKGFVCGASVAVAASLMWWYGLGNFHTLLFWAVAPRVIYLIADVYSNIIIFPKVKRMLSEDTIQFYLIEGHGIHRFLFRIKESYLHMLSRTGKTVSNADIIITAMRKGRNKTDNSKHEEKSKRSETRTKLEAFENRVSSTFENEISCISQKGFEAFRNEAESRLRQCSKISPHEFIKFKFPEKSDEWLPMGVEFFVIKAFAPLVENGRIIDDDISDDILEHHAYSHTESNVPIKRTIANQNPLLALDDDDDIIIEYPTVEVDQSVVV